MTTTNYTRDALLRFPEAERRGLLESCRTRINRDPDNTDAVTALWYAIYQQIVDLETEERQLFEAL